jgi:hypothetical protein
VRFLPTFPEGKGEAGQRNVRERIEISSTIQRQLLDIDSFRGWRDPAGYTSTHLENEYFLMNRF